ncbi:MAG: VTT domain-containing protein [Nanoarchaeota archaeon]
MVSIIDVALHLDKYLGMILTTYGGFIYLILFLIVFFETGLVLTPFLPGDSLIFIAGIFAGGGLLNVFLLFVIFCSAAIIGDTVNYWLGGYFGKKFFAKHINPKYVEKTEHFYQEYGAKTIVIARFIPVVRTIAPFLAGVSKMDYNKFILYNIMGAVSWVAIFLFGGYFLGSVPFVKDHLSIIVAVLIVITSLPPVIGYLRKK